MGRKGRLYIKIVVHGPLIPLCIALLLKGFSFGSLLSGVNARTPLATGACPTRRIDKRSSSSSNLPPHMWTTVVCGSARFRFAVQPQIR